MRKIYPLALKNNGKVTLEENILAVISFGDLVLRWIFQNKLRTNSCLANYMDKRKTDKGCSKFFSTATPQDEQGSHTGEAFSPHHAQNALLWR